MDLNVISFNNIEILNELKFNGETLLSYRIEYPVFVSEHYRGSIKKINRLYMERALAFQKYCQNELFNMAVEQYKEDMQNGFPVRKFEALQVYEVTYLFSCIISLYFDRYEFTGGAHGNTVRSSQTWNLKNCSLIALRQLITCSPDYKAYILADVYAQIQNEPELYFENYNELISKTFNPRNFFCVPDGIIIYYQQYDIAPYSSGMREFFLPYTNCVKDPLTLCQCISHT